MAKKPPRTAAQKTIVYDGLCTMCKGLTNAVAHSTQKQQFQTVDFTSQQLPDSMSREQAEKEVHVIDADGTVHRNVDAVFAIIETYPRLAWLARVGRLPGIHAILALLYKLVAAHRHFVWGDIGRLYWLKAVVAVGLIGGILASLPLWLTDRALPMVPFFDWWPVLGQPFDSIALVILLGLLGVLVVTSRPRWYIAGFLILLVALCLGDQMRWQPWVYQYAAIMGALGLFSWRAQDASGQSRALNICRLIIAATYIWSGIHKLNIGFVFGMAPWMLQPITDGMPSVIDPYVLSFGAFMPIIEIAIGVGLLATRLRTKAVIGAVGMHLGILVLLGPFGQNWNAVVWPWNGVMIASVLLLFWHTPQVRLMHIVWSRRFAYHWIALLLFGLLPVLSLFGKWDAYLSSALYSSDLVRGVVRINAPQGTATIRLADWSHGVLHVPPYPEPRVFKRVAASLCASSGDKTLQLTLTFHQTPFRRGFAEVYHCNSLVTRPIRY